MVLYYMNESAMGKAMKANPEDRKKYMEPWMVWAKKCGKGLVDMGSPLGNAHKISKKNHGPSKSFPVVCGYSILQAESWDKVREMMKEHPHINYDAGCEIEIHESMPM